MVNVHTATTALLEFIRNAGLIAAQFLSRLEFLLRDQLLALGLPRLAQTLILIAVTAILVLGTFRLFIGLLRIGALVILLLIASRLVIALAQG